jgi:DNA replication protein DnaC
MNRRTEDTPCSRCNGDLYRVELHGEFARAVRCDCSGTCEHCHGTAIAVRVIDGDRVAAPCRCSSLDRRIQLFNEAHLPAKFANCWIEDIEETHRSQKELKYKLLKYRETYSRFDSGFLLWGDPGVGKTHLLCGLVGYLTLERGIPCRFIEFMRLIMDLKHAYSEGRWDSDVIAPLLAVDVLVIDELGKGRNSDYELAILDQLISSRYNSQRTIHCTSNYAPEGVARRPEELAMGLSHGMLAGAEGLRERVGDRVFSRLHEMCRFVHVEGKDYRKIRKR